MIWRDVLKRYCVKVPVQLPAIIKKSTAGHSGTDTLFFYFQKDIIIDAGAI